MTLQQLIESLTSDLTEAKALTVLEHDGSVTATAGKKIMPSSPAWEAWKTKNGRTKASAPITKSTPEGSGKKAAAWEGWKAANRRTDQDPPLKASLKQEKGKAVMAAFRLRTGR